jgi:hypothetical protein
MPPAITSTGAKSPLTDPDRPILNEIAVGIALCVLPPVARYCFTPAPSLIRTVRSTRWEALSIFVSGAVVKSAYPWVTYICRNLSSPARISVRLNTSPSRRRNCSQRVAADMPSARSGVTLWKEMLRSRN